MHSKASDIVWVSLKGDNFLVCVIVEDSELVVVRAGDKPVFASNKTAASDRDFCDFKSLYERARFVVVDVDSAVVQSGKQPWFCWVEINALDSLRPGE